MPTYDYECQKCGHTFEKFQSMLDEHLKRCPECKGKLKRLIGTGAGVIFKGSGFYETDYRSDSYKTGEKGEKGEKGETSDKGDKGESKKSDGEGGKAKADSGSGDSGKKTESKREKSAAKSEKGKKGKSDS